MRTVSYTHLDVYKRQCQTIQMHDLPPQSVVEIMKRALDYDIITRGGGGHDGF